jgi:SIR2-like domain
MPPVGPAAETKPKTKLAAERLQEAVELPDDTWKAARALAKQLKDRPILPLIGAGMSFDCGMETAKPVAQRMYRWYESNSGVATPPSDLKTSDTDLGLVADAVYAARDQKRVIEALGLADENDWPDAKGLPKHFCSYRVLARLAREDLIAEALTLNYDCCFERGLEDEGFRFAPWNLRGKTWLDHATVVADGTDHVQLDPRGQLVLTKAHGCAAAFRGALKEFEEAATVDRRLREKMEKAEEAIVIRRGQLLDWRTDFWARDLFADRARRHVILMLGVSGQDPVIHVALTRVLEEVYGHLGETNGEPCLDPRVIAIDRYPDTVALRALIHEGCGRRQVGEGVVTAIEVPNDSSMTAVLTALAVEMLACRLQREANVALPPTHLARVTSMTITVPASLRWAYFLERRLAGDGFLQRANLEQAGERGYVPLALDSTRVAASMRLRDQLRKQFKLSGDEGVDEALSNFGFIAVPKRGRAFMPLGVGVEELRAASVADLIAATNCFQVPLELEPVLVAGLGNDTIGRAVETGKEVTVP